MERAPEKQTLPILSEDQRDMLRRKISEMLGQLRLGTEASRAQTEAMPTRAPTGLQELPATAERARPRSVSVMSPARSGQAPGFVGFQDPEARRVLSRRRLSDEAESPFDILLTKLDEDEARLAALGVPPQLRAQAMRNLQGQRFQVEMARLQDRKQTQAMNQEILSKAYDSAMKLATDKESPVALDRAFEIASRRIGDPKLRQQLMGMARGVGAQPLPIRKEVQEERELAKLSTLAQLMETLERGERQERMQQAGFAFQREEGVAEREARAEEAEKIRTAQRAMFDADMAHKKSAFDEEKTHRAWVREIETFKANVEMRRRDEMPHEKQLELASQLAEGLDRSLQGIATAESDDPVLQSGQMISRARSFIRTLRDTGKYDETVIRDIIDQGIRNPSIRNFLMFEEALKAGQGRQALYQITDPEMTHPAALAIVERNVTDPSEREAIIGFLEHRRQRQLKRTALGHVFGALGRAFPGGEPLFRGQRDLEEAIDRMAAEAILEGTMGRSVLRGIPELLPLPPAATPEPQLSLPQVF